jgi:hypothetical protein
VGVHVAVQALNLSKGALVEALKHFASKGASLGLVEPLTLMGRQQIQIAE